MVLALFVVEMNICLFPMHNITSLKQLCAESQDMVSLTSINSLNINMRKIKRIFCLALSVCVCSRLAIVMIICCVMALIRNEGDVTTFGAVGDGKTDCSKAINSAIASLPSEGGVVVIPEGDFVLDAPIVINKHNVTFKGLNPGMRSNIDVNGINELLGPGGGSKLVAA